MDIWGLALARILTVVEWCLLVSLGFEGKGGSGLVIVTRKYRLSGERSVRRLLLHDPQSAVGYIL